MFGLGTTELLLILVIAFLIYGPKRLPELAKSLGKVARDVRQATDEVKEAVHDEGEKVKETIRTTTKLSQEELLAPEKEKNSDGE